MSEQSIRIIIADDHPLVRSGLRAVMLLYDDIKIVGEAVNGREAVALCGRLQPDVALMDVMMPEMDGIVATQLIRNQFPRIQVVVLTSSSDPQTLNQILDAGAIGYLQKDISPDELADAIRNASKGRPALSSQALLTLVTKRTRETSAATLSPKEKEVLALMVEGRTNKEIADQLVISIATVKYHVSNILGKLGVETRTEAVALALREKLLP